MCLWQLTKVILGVGEVIDKILEAVNHLLQVDSLQQDGDAARCLDAVEASVRGREKMIMLSCA